MMDSMGSTLGTSRHPRDWTASAQLNMTNAMGAQQGAASQSDTSKKAHRTCLDDNLSQYSGLHASLEKKVKDSRAVLGMLQKRVESVTSSIHQSKRSLADLEEAHRAKEAPLQLCEWRRDERDKRPAREQIRDALETCLESEKETLLACKQQLRESVKKTQATIQGLCEMLRELQEDVADKGQAKDIDEMCLRTTHKGWQSSIERSTKRGSPKKSPGPAADAVMESEHGANESGRQGEAKRECQKAMEMERAAQALREESTRAIDRCQRQSDVARKSTEKSMQDRIKENQGMRKRLEEQIRETSGKVDHMNQTTTSTSMKLRSLEDPMKLNSTREEWRKARPSREGIADPVSTRLIEHQNSLMRTAGELTKRREIERHTLGDLQSNQDQLKADLRDKTEALRIDLNCLHHEVVYRGGRSVLAPDARKLQRAMQIDPLFSPTGGMTGALSAR